MLPDELYENLSCEDVEEAAGVLKSVPKHKEGMKEEEREKAVLKNPREYRTVLRSAEIRRYRLVGHEMFLGA